MFSEAYLGSLWLFIDGLSTDQHGASALWSAEHIAAFSVDQTSWKIRSLRGTGHGKYNCTIPFSIWPVTARGWYRSAYMREPNSSFLQGSMPVARHISSIDAAASTRAVTLHPKRATQQPVMQSPPGEAGTLLPSKPTGGKNIAMAAVCRFGLYRRAYIIGQVRGRETGLVGWLLTRQDDGLAPANLMTDVCRYLTVSPNCFYLAIKVDDQGLGDCFQLKPEPWARHLFVIQDERSQLVQLGRCCGPVRIVPGRRPEISCMSGSTHTAGYAVLERLGIGLEKVSRRRSWRRR